MSRRLLKKIVTLTMVFALCLSFNAVAFAQTTEPAIENEIAVAEETNTVTPRTIVGSNSAYINGYGEFTVYCSGWSLFGKAQITVSNTSSNNIVTIDILKPNGSSVISGNPIVVTGPQVINQNLVNLGEDYYTIVVQTSTGGANVSVSFGDR